MSKLVDHPNYKLAKIILSKRDQFTLKEVMEDVQNEGLPIQDDKQLKNILRKFRDNGIIIEHGSKYSLSSFVFK